MDAEEDVVENENVIGKKAQKVKVVTGGEDNVDVAENGDAVSKQEQDTKDKEKEDRERD